MIHQLRAHGLLLVILTEPASSHSIVTFLAHLAHDFLRCVQIRVRDRLLLDTHGLGIAGQAHSTTALVH